MLAYREAMDFNDNAEYFPVAEPNVRRLFRPSPTGESTSYVLVALGGLVLAGLSGVAALWLATTPETWWLAVLPGLWAVGFLFLALRAAVALRRLERRARRLHGRGAGDDQGPGRVG